MSSHRVLYGFTDLQDSFFVFVNRNAFLDKSLPPWVSSFICLYSLIPELLTYEFPFMISFPGLALIMWNGLYTAEKVIIQWTLLSEACFFAVQFLGE